MPNHKQSHQWSLQVQGIGTLRSFPAMIMESGIGALVCWTVLEISRNVRVDDSNLHTLRIGIQRTWLSLFCPSTGCLACWCPCLAHDQNRRRLDYLNIHGVPDPDRHKHVGCESMLYGVLEVACDLGWILQVSRLIFRISRSIS